MDLSFSRLIAAADAPLPVADMALLLAMLAVRQGASATALVQAALDRSVAAAGTDPLFAPTSGAFSPAMATQLADWRNP